MQEEIARRFVCNDAFYISIDYTQPLLQASWGIQSVTYKLPRITLRTSDECRPISS